MRAYRNPLACEPSNPFNNVNTGYVIDDADTRSYSELMADAYRERGMALPEWLAREVLGLSESAMRHALPRKVVE
jgi:hypothetical protein